MALSPPLEFLESTPSTMDEARERIRDGRVTFDSRGAPSALGVAARAQTAGRGQRGRGWFTAAGECVCATYYLRHALALPDEAGRIPIVAGVAIAELLAEAIPELSFGLKWPNDLIVADKKVGGILVEMAQAPDGGWVALVGVGINVRVREFPLALRDTATSIAIEEPFAGLLPVSVLARTVGLTLHARAIAFSPASYAAHIAAWRGRDAS
ncbi:MAG TPA: biotin--[acetyl-CoA-carboxylase] ligase, partial [Chthonomonadaceae bacterium]|nr:biotin--[acetyl-CoA-carboxylase] ligase [Chthonomonadaceae bacterium]